MNTRELYYDNEFIYRFDYPIKQVIRINNLFVVLIQSPKGEFLNENVFGVSKKKGLHWIVQAVDRVNEDSPYTNMTIKEEGIELSNWEGNSLLIDPYNGRIIKEYKEGRPW